jgi:thiopurine S-methyltransferase
VNHEFWKKRWAAQEIGFHLSAPNPVLVRHYERWVGGSKALAAPGSRVLVPLSGKSLDLTFLAEHGHQVTGIELVEDAVKAYYRERGVVPQVSEGPLYQGAGVTSWVHDLFALDDARLGKFAGIFDRAALIAIEPSRRREYASKCSRWLEQGDGRILLVTLDFDESVKPGPPHAFSAAEVRALYGSTAELVSDEDALPNLPRFAAAGIRKVREMAWIVG